LKYIQNRKIAVIGFGSQGHAHAMIWRIGLRRRGGPEKHECFRREGAEGRAASAACASGREEAEIVMILFPTNLRRACTKAKSHPAMKAGKYLAFSHGFGIHFGFIKPPKDVNVFMVAPKGPGHLVRHQFSQGAGVPCLLAIHQDPSAHQEDRAGLR